MRLLAKMRPFPSNAWREDHGPPLYRTAPVINLRSMLFKLVQYDSRLLSCHYGSIQAPTIDITTSVWYKTMDICTVPLYIF